MAVSSADVGWGSFLGQLCAEVDQMTVCRYLERRGVGALGLVGGTWCTPCTTITCLPVPAEVGVARAASTYVL